jgi:hypothetical protein
MVRRISVFVRGLGVLIIALAAVVAATLISQRHAQSSRGAVSATAEIPAASGTPLATSTPAPPATLPYRATVVGPKSFLDRGSGTSATVDDVRIGQVAAGGLPAPQQLDLLYMITIHHAASGTVHYSAGNFYALAASGETYGAATTVPRLPALRSGVLGPNGTASGWIRFTLPSSPATLTLVWNDDNHLLLPASFARTVVGRAPGR